MGPWQGLVRGLYPASARQARGGGFSIAAVIEDTAALSSIQPILCPCGAFLKNGFALQQTGPVIHVVEVPAVLVTKDTIDDFIDKHPDAMK